MDSVELRAQIAECEARLDLLYGSRREMIVHEWRQGVSTRVLGQVWGISFVAVNKQLRKAAGGEDINVLRR